MFRPYIEQIKIVCFLKTILYIIIFFFIKYLGYIYIKTFFKLIIIFIIFIHRMGNSYFKMI